MGANEAALRAGHWVRFSSYEITDGVVHPTKGRPVRPLRPVGGVPRCPGVSGLAFRKRATTQEDSPPTRSCCG